MIPETGTPSKSERGIMEILNLLSNGDISGNWTDIQKLWGIYHIFKKYYRYVGKKGKNSRNISFHPNKSTTPTLTKFDLRVMLDDIKIDILKSISMQLDMM